MNHNGDISGGLDNIMLCYDGDISGGLDNIVLCYLVFYEIEPSKCDNDKDQDNADANRKEVNIIVHRAISFIIETGQKNTKRGNTLQIQIHVLALNGQSLNSIEIEVIN